MPDKNQKTATSPNSQRLALEHFLPYRLSVLTNTVSSNLARVYAEKFDMTIPEWRVMATLGRYPGIAASEVANRTAMDKVRVSRAIGRLKDAGRVTRTVDSGDRRRSALHLTAKGQAIYREIVPLAEAYEVNLIDALNAEEIEWLDRILNRLQTRAQELSSH